MKSSIRSLAYFAVAAQAAFIAAWLVAEAVQPDYSGVESGVSALAADGASDPWIAMAGFALLGLGIAALSPGLRFVLPRRPAATLAAGLFAIAGLSCVVVAFSRVDCDLATVACSARFDAGELSWQTGLHVWAGLVMKIALVLTPFALARALWPSPAGALALLCAGVGAAITAAAWILYDADGSDGLLERIELVVLHLWIVIVAAGILYETRSAPRLSDPVALRPRDFFGSAWSGQGVVLGFPAFLTRPFCARFDFSRETTWLSDEVALVRDRAVLPGGRVEERVRYARFDDPSHIHVTSDDMPDGADVTISEAGYRIAPYRVAVPVGPLRFLVRARDSATVEADGTLEYVVRISWHGLPVACVEMRSRPVDTEPARSPAPAALTA